MKRRLAVPLMAVSLLLSACATTGGTSTIDQQQLVNVEIQVQQTAVNICKFVPTLSAVAGVIATFVAKGAAFDIVNQTAQVICAAVQNVPVIPAQIGNRNVLRIAAPPSVNGIPIDGYFLK